MGPCMDPQSLAMRWQAKAQGLTGARRAGAHIARDGRPGALYTLGASLGAKHESG